ncbi:MAG: hypothetical protein SF123_20380 [Chloroflexota bacterium]|nr:hypothetical protein [Chloroflexota bacterium]
MMVRNATLLLVLTLLLAACGGQAAPTTTPVPPTLPVPTVELPPEPVVPQPTVFLPTLPPTWTPIVTPTVFAPEIDLTNAALLVQPTNAVCTGFLSDRAQSARFFGLGQPVVVVWTPVPTAASYRVTLFDRGARALWFDLTTDIRITIPGEFLVGDSLFGWEVRPYDAAGVQLCLPVGDEIALQ